jgi:hypothetical protein
VESAVVATAALSKRSESYGYRHFVALSHPMSAQVLECGSTAGCGGWWIAADKSRTWPNESDSASRILRVMIGTSFSLVVIRKPRLHDSTTKDLHEPVHSFTGLPSAFSTEAGMRRSSSVTPMVAGPGSQAIQSIVATTPHVVQGEFATIPRLGSQAHSTMNATTQDSYRDS